MKICLCSTVIIIMVSEVLIADFSEAGNHSRTATDTMINVTFISFKVCLINGHYTILLIESIFVFDSSHSDLLFLIRYKVQMCIQDDANTRKDVYACGILPLLNTGKICCIDASEDGQITSFHLLGFA